MFCKKCGRKLNDGARFCPGCGTQIIVKQSAQAVSSAGHICLACGAPLRKGAAFCMKCGTKVQTAAAPACEACGAPLKDGAAFCMKCGTKVKTVAARACVACGASLRDGAAFCMKCGAPVSAGAAVPTVTIPIPPEAAPKDITVSVSDTPPVSAPSRREAKAKKPLMKQAEQRAVQTAKQTAKKAAGAVIRQVLDLEVPAAETAGEMRIPMSAEQKRCLTSVIKMLGRAAR
jgi:uncharacterized Zn finger protein (UPF0148 family)